VTFTFGVTEVANYEGFIFELWSGFFDYPQPALVKDFVKPL
jgi:hypothetical protein